MHGIGIYRIYRVSYILMTQDSVQRYRVWHGYKGGNDSLPGWPVSEYNDINHFRTIPRYSHSHRTVPAQQISFLAKQYQIFKLGRGWWSEWSEIFFHRFKFSKLKWRDIDACLCFNDVFIFPIWDPEGVWLTIITRSLVKHTGTDTECQSSLWQFRPGPGPMSPHDHRSPTSHLSYNVNAKYATKIIQTSAIVLIRYMDMVIDDVVGMRHY